MNQFFFFCLAFVGGVFLAIQASLNANLGMILKQPIFASVAQSVSSTVFSLVIVACSVKTLPNSSIIKEVPIYLWFTGGFFSLLGISLYYFTIPRLGLSTMMSIGLSGQLILAVVASHYGWFNMPMEPVSLKKLLGIAFMLVAIMLIKIK